MRETIARILEIPKPPADRGHWLTVEQVRAMLGNQVSRKWVYAHVPNKIRLSQKVVGWYEDEVRAWIEGRRVA